MTDASAPGPLSSPTTTPEPGWYADAADPRYFRWWDGSAWTQHIGPPASPLLNQRPALRPGTPVYNAFVWVVAGLPLLPAVLVLAWNPQVRFVTSSTGDPVPDPSYLLDAGYFLIIGSLAFVYLASVVLAFFDYRSLRSKGVVRPFHWAWAFMYMGSLVYMIGRTVVLNKVAPRRGWVPMAVLIAGWLLYMVLASLKSMELMRSVFSGMGYGA
ncbi:DUF2510 domain-containing protein [Paenarthrobacter sp. NPDC057981]|uniref:DUF2510 domain-containing protein n=1 Tax=Paenarthrobacter sp. NPDC057981 TaxID=3346297 RepID=UPI0036DB4A02